MELLLSRKEECKPKSIEEILMALHETKSALQQQQKAIEQLELMIVNYSK